MTREDLKQKLSVIISATNTSGNQKLDAILELLATPSKELKSAEEMFQNMNGGKTVNTSVLHGETFTAKYVVNFAEVYVSHLPVLSVDNIEKAMNYAYGQSKHSKLSIGEVKSRYISSLNKKMTDHASQFQPTADTGNDFAIERLYEWIMDEKRKPATIFFTSGELRNVAKEIEFRLWKKSGKDAVTEAVFTKDDMGSAVEFGYRQCKKYGYISPKEESDFINSKTKNNEHRV